MEGQRRRRAVVRRTCRRTGRRHFEGERRVKIQSYERTYGSETSATPPSHWERRAAAVSASERRGVGPPSPASARRPCGSRHGFRRAQACRAAAAACRGEKAARIGPQTPRGFPQKQRQKRGLSPAPGG